MVDLKAAFKIFRLIWEWSIISGKVHSIKQIVCFHRDESRHLPSAGDDVGLFAHSSVEYVVHRVDGDVAVWRSPRQPFASALGFAHADHIVVDFVHKADKDS